MEKSNLPDIKKVNLYKPSYNVIGTVHPFRPEYKVSGNVPEGTLVYDAIRQSCEAAKVRRRLINYGVAQIGRRNYEKQITEWRFIPFSQWKKHKLKADELLRFRILPRGGGGGGGKSGINTILSVVVAVAAVAAAAFTGGLSIFASTGALYLGGAGGAIAAGLAGMAVLTIGQALVNAIAPIKAPSLGSFSSSTRADEPDVYSISSGRNSVKQWGRVPVPVGRGRFAPPKGASPYTKIDGDDQYLHELFCLGIGDMQISEIKIGSNPIENFDDCLYEIMTYNPNSPRAPRYYPTGIYEETLNIQLKKDQDNIRTTNECDYAEIDFSFQGLCWLNDQGDPEKTKVCFKIQYKASDGTPWENVGKRKFIKGVSNYHPKDGTGVVGINYNTGLFFRANQTTVADNEVKLGTYEVKTQTETYEYCEDDYPGTEPNSLDRSGRSCQTVTKVKKTCKFTKDIQSHGYYLEGFEVTTPSVQTQLKDSIMGKPIKWGISVASGYLTKAGSGSGINEFCVEGAQTRLLRKTYRIDFPKRGAYAISVIRLTDDSTENRMQNDSYWTALRSCTKDLPVKTKYPVMLLSLQVRASGQLSGSLDNLTVYYETKCWDYDVPTGKWQWQYTSNPASIFRYILQQKDAFSMPQPDSLIDLPNIIDAYKYYDSLDFGFDKVFDSSASVFERLISIGASALSSPTMLEGKWGIIVDKPRTNVISAFTSANAWNWSFERQQIRLPNAIHCNFINQDTWDADMRVVPTDEENTGNYLYETQEYDGVVSPAQVYLLARFHYADAKMRRRTISFRCFDEAILCTRGDLVELACPNISVQGLQVGRVRAINKNSSGEVVSIGTDQINTTDLSGRRFGVKIYSNSGDIFIAEVYAENASQRSLMFVTPQAMDIQRGNKYAFGDYGEETFPAVVLSMKFNPDWTCDVSCTDYVLGIYGDLSKPIPDWTSVITRPIEFKWELLTAPIVVKIVSDETALVRGSDNSIQCRMLIYMDDPKNLDPRSKYYNCEIREVQDDSDPENIIYGQWQNVARGVPIEQSQFYVNDVNEGQKYQVRVRYAGVAGDYGPWCEIVEHTVVGRTSIPPDVKNFKATIDNPNGIKLEWEMLKVLDISHYDISGDAIDSVQSSPVIEKVYNKTGTISFSIVAVDFGARKSAHPATASVTVLPPANPVFEYARLLNPGIVAKWFDAKTTWDIAKYTLSCRGVSIDSEELEAVIPFSGKFPKGEYAKLRCIDIFNNRSVADSSQLVSIYYPQSPNVTIGMNKINGNVTLDWQDCKNSTIDDAPEIDYYEISGTLANNKTVSVRGTHYESIVPLIVYEFGAGSIEGGIPVHVGNLYIRVIAVDKYGIRSDDNPSFVDNAKNFAIYPPYNPTDFGVSASLTSGDNLKANWTEATAIMLTWKDCERTFAIDYYIVKDHYTNTEYKVATNYVVLPARKEGSYKVEVQAFDILGLSSGNMEYNLTIAGVGGMEVKARIDGSDILLEWDTPPASFQIDHYIVFEDNDDLPEGNNSDLNKDGYVGQAKFNYFRIPATSTGTFTYYVWAVDVAGNINTDFANYVTITIAENEAPVVLASLSGNGVQVNWKLTNKPANTLPAAAWEIRRYHKLANASQIPLNTPVEDYGIISADKINVSAFTKGDYSFAVRAIDTGSNYGKWGLCDFSAKAPGQVTFTTPVVIDNNVQLYWTEPNYIFFPIKEYLFEEVDKDTGVHMRIGLVDALFASETEELAGEYTYAITPIDWGGNLGTPTTIRLRVSQPPDFVFYDSKDSLFNGTKTNLVLDGKGHMLGPVPVGETWQQNVTRMQQVAGTAITTHQQKINKGWKYWLQPEVSSGTYVEVIDHGAIVPSTNYRITLGYQALSGNPTITCKLEISQDNKKWELVSNNTLSAYVTQFRYSRITLTITGGYVQINNLNIRLDVKKLTDYGRVTSKATDNGAGWTSEAATPMLTGTWVPFKVKFVDVQSFPRPNVVVTNTAQTGYTAYVVFEDVLNPTGFRVFVKDKNGTRVTADVEWQAFGV